jgi:hypothetical protein
VKPKSQAEHFRAKALECLVRSPRAHDPEYQRLYCELGRNGWSLLTKRIPQRPNRFRAAPPRKENQLAGLEVGLSIRKARRRRTGRANSILTRVLRFSLSAARGLRGAARAGAEGKRAEAERKAAVEAQKIVAIWNARQAGGRALWFYPTIGAAIAAGVPWLCYSCPACQQVGLVELRTLDRHPRRLDLKPHPVCVVPTVLTESAFREA